MANVLVVAELAEDGKLKKSTLSAITFARQALPAVGGAINILVLGGSTAGAARGGAGAARDGRGPGSAEDEEGRAGGARGAAGGETGGRRAAAGGPGGLSVASPLPGGEGGGKTRYREHGGRNSRI